MEGMNETIIEITDKNSCEIIYTADALQTVVALYANMAVGRIKSTPESKKAAQDFIKELCTTLFQV